MSEVLEIYADELPCNPEEIPGYLKTILSSDMEDEEKYAAIERYTLMRERRFYKIEWPEPEAVAEEDMLQAELDYYEEVR